MHSLGPLLLFNVFPTRWVFQSDVCTRFTVQADWTTHKTVSALMFVSYHFSYSNNTVRTHKYTRIDTSLWLWLHKVGIIQPNAYVRCAKMYLLRVAFYEYTLWHWLFSLLLLMLLLLLLLLLYTVHHVMPCYAIFNLT